MTIVTCGQCGQRFDGIQAYFAHICEQPPDGNDDDRRVVADGGQFELDGDIKARVVFTSGGIQFRSEPMPLEMAQEYANGIGQATVPAGVGTRPLADDERARIEPLEATRDE